jgi:small-conductance mechanosensitive channel/CRP-like cAMP-binding protein
MMGFRGVFCVHRLDERAGVFYSDFLTMSKARHSNPMAPLTRTLLLLLAIAFSLSSPGYAQAGFLTGSGKPAEKPGSQVERSAQGPANKAGKPSLAGRADGGDQASTGTLKADDSATTGTVIGKAAAYLGKGWRDSLAVFLAFVLIAILLQRVFNRIVHRQPAGSALKKVFVRIGRIWPALLLCTGLNAVLHMLWDGMPGAVSGTIAFINYFLLFFAFLWPLDTFVFDYYCTEKRQIRIPRLLRDVIRWPIYLLALGYAYHVVFKGSVAALFATSAVLSFILGLALQDTLSNLFAGLAIHFEGSFALGDWVRVGNQEGEVSAITWRAIKIRTREDNYMIIPNTSIAKGEIINYSQPTPVTGLALEIGVSYEVPPGKVERVILEVVSEINEALKHPEPVVQLKQYGDSAIVYRIRFWMRDFAHSGLIAHKVYSGIWYHFKREGIEIPFPIRTVYMREALRSDSAEITRRKADKLDSVDFLQPLSRAEREDLARDMHEVMYARNEVILQGDVVNDRFYLLESGKASVERSLAGRMTTKLAELHPGEFFGEYSLLTGDKTSATVRAMEDVLVSVLKKESFERLLKSHPTVAERISNVLAERTEQRHKALDTIPTDSTAPLPPVSGQAAEHTARRIRDRIRRFFGLA